MRIVLFGSFRPYRYGQCVRWFVRRLEFHDPTFLHPFAPPALPGFNATMSALTPGRSALRLAIEHELRPCNAQVSSLTGWNLPTIPPPTTVRRTLSSVLAWFLLSDAEPRGMKSPSHRCDQWRNLGFALAMQARHDSRPNRVHFRCGLVVRLPVLSTPPHGDAVPVDHRSKP